MKTCTKGLSLNHIIDRDENTRKVKGHRYVLQDCDDILVELVIYRNRKCYEIDVMENLKNFVAATSPKIINQTQKARDATDSSKKSFGMLWKKLLRFFNSVKIFSTTYIDV